ncbi:MAG: maleylpyruvate isomerase N-terminal domain-containing protein, partial [Ferrimicrobium sp.]
MTPPDALTGCAGWTAHEAVAHLVAAGVEVALNLEAHGGAVPCPLPGTSRSARLPTGRWAMGDADLRAVLPRSIERVAVGLDTVLGANPDAVVPWTGRQMVVATFVTHLRSELAIHRFDLVGDDETGTKLLGQPELTDHAVPSRASGWGPVT